MSDYIVNPVEKVLSVRIYLPTGTGFFWVGTVKKKHPVAKHLLLTEILLNDILHGICLPFIIYFIAHGTYPMQASFSSDLIFVLLQVWIEYT